MGIRSASLAQSSPTRRPTACTSTGKGARMSDSAYPVTPSRAARTRRGSRALATAGAATLALLAAGTTTAHAEPPPETPQARTGNSPLLKCRLRTAPGARITFSPAVSSTPSHISDHGAVNLDDCTSPNGRQLHINSG